MKQHAPATLRNRQPILDVLRHWLPTRGLVLEIASGSGEHAVYFSSNLPGMTWQPTDMGGDALGSIAAWRADSGQDNLLLPLRLDVCEQPWPVDRADALFCANMIHISPWDSTLALMDGAGRVLVPGGVLILYGPFRMEGTHTAVSNEAFDRDLKGRNPAWGVRDLEAVDRVAAAAGLVRQAVIAMPANNHCVVWRKPA